MENNQVKLIPREVREAIWPEAYFLTKEQQSQYEESIKKYSGKARESLSIPREGSNLFKVLLLNQEGIRTATLSELEQAIDNGMILKGTYEDAPSVVLRSNGNSYQPNDYLAKYLFKEVKKRDKKLETLKHSLILNGLKLKEDNNSSYGLILEPNENFEFFEAPELDHENNHKKFSRLNERGMPIFDENGSRTLYTKQDGLCGLYSGVDLGLYSYVGPLEGSGSLGRVVVVSPKGAEKIFDEYILKLKRDSESQKLEIDARFNRATNYLKTGKL